jgi:hypothetical protein
MGVVTGVVLFIRALFASQATIVAENLRMTLTATGCWSPLLLLNKPLVHTELRAVESVAWCRAWC